MRVIRPRALTPTDHRRALILSFSMIAAGVLAAQLAFIGPVSVVRSGILGTVAAIGLGVGCAWLLRVLRPTRMRTAGAALAALLAEAFEDDYTLVVAPRLPVRDAGRLDGILVGPAGVRVITVRDWDGRYRVRGRIWEFDARGRRGWIRCRTNPSFDATALCDGVASWATAAGLGDLPIKPAIAFPNRRSRLVLEEPVDEIVTTDNAPWWANSIGRVRRLDADGGARLLTAILDAAEGGERLAGAPATERL